MRRSGGKRRRAAVVLAVVFLCVAALEFRLFVFPAIDVAAPADAVVVFGGPGERTARGWDLARAGLAPTVVVSIHDPSLCEPIDDDPEEICLTADPPTTRGEARAFAQLARERGWDELIAVTTSSQSTRARLRFERCYDGQVRWVTVRENDVAMQAFRVLYENGAMLKALLVEREC